MLLQAESLQAVDSLQAVVWCKSTSPDLWLAGLSDWLWCLCIQFLTLIHGWCLWCTCMLTRQTTFITAYIKSVPSISIFDLASSVSILVPHVCVRRCRNKSCISDFSLFSALVLKAYLKHSMSEWSVILTQLQLQQPPICLIH